MPIYAPTLPPRPNLEKGKPPFLVLARFDLSRILRQKLGRFFGFVFTCVLLIQLTAFYFHQILETNSDLANLKGTVEQFLPNSAQRQASLLPQHMLLFLWFQVTLIGGALISRDTLYRIRPLIFAHPVRQLDYLASKVLVAFMIPFCIQLIFVISPWLMSILIAGTKGPVWPTAPLYLIPAAALNSIIMASIALGASSLAGTPKASVGWAIGLIFGLSALCGILSGIFWEPMGTSVVYLQAINPIWLTYTWPKILCGVEQSSASILPAITATLANICLWGYIVKRRTMPSETVI